MAGRITLKGFLRERLPPRVVAQVERLQRGREALSLVTGLAGGVVTRVELELASRLQAIAETDKVLGDLRISRCLSDRRAPEGHYALFDPALKMLHQELGDALSGDLPVHEWSNRGFLLHGSHGTGKTEFVYDLVSRLADAGTEVNLFYITEDYFEEGASPVIRLRQLFWEAEEAARRTGKRSILLWDNPEVLMSHKYQVMQAVERTRMSSKSTTSISERTVSPGDDVAIRMASLLEKILAGATQPLVNTVLICTTNNFAAIDPALYRIGRLKPFTFPRIYTLGGILPDRIEPCPFVSSLLHLFPVVISQLSRIGAFHPDPHLNIRKVIESIRAIEETLRGAITTASQSEGLAGQQSASPNGKLYGELRHTTLVDIYGEQGMALPLFKPSAPPIFSTPAEVYNALKVVLAKTPSEVKREWGNVQAKALVEYLFRLASNHPDRSLLDLSRSKGEGYVTDPLGFVLKDVLHELEVALGIEVSPEEIDFGDSMPR